MAIAIISLNKFPNYQNYSTFVEFFSLSLPDLELYSNMSLKYKYNAIPNNVILLFQQHQPKQEHLNDFIMCFKHFYDDYLNSNYTDRYYQLLSMTDLNFLSTIEEDLVLNKSSTTKNAYAHVYDEETVFGYVEYTEEILIVISPPLGGKTEFCWEYCNYFPIEVDKMYNPDEMKALGYDPKTEQWHKEKYLRMENFLIENNMPNTLYFIHHYYDLEPFDKLKLKYKVIGAYIPTEQLAQASPRWSSTSKWYYGSVKAIKTHPYAKKYPITYFNSYEERNRDLIKMLIKNGKQATIKDSSSERIRQLNESLNKTTEQTTEWHRRYVETNRKNLYSYTKRDIRRILNPKTPDHIKKEILRNLYPYPNKQLAKVQRVDYGLIIKLINEYSGNKTYLQQMLKGCLGLGIQGLAGYLMLGIFRPRMQVTLLWLCKQGILNNGIKYAAKWLKALHNLCRRSQMIPIWLPVDRTIVATDLMYLDLLVGRFYAKKLALDTTIEDRQQLRIHKAFNGEDFDEETHDMIMDKCLNEVGERLRWHTISREEGYVENERKGSTNTFENFRANYLSIGAAGSSTSGKRDLMHLENTRVNKRMWLSEAEDKRILDILRKEPKVMTTCIIKTELSKLRQLIPGPIDHWLAETIVLWKSEKAIYRSTPSIFMEKQPHILFQRLMRRRLQVQLSQADKITMLALDYKDFNITHCFKDMIKVWRMIANVYRLFSNIQDKSWSGTNYYIYSAKVIEWLVKCYDAMYARADGGDGVFHKLIQGLWTGWRSTAFLNILFNYLYSEVCKEVHIAMFGHRLQKEVENMGDDVTSITDTAKDAIFTVMTYQEMNHELQNSKQLIGCATEFLRLTYSQDKVMGSFNRGLGSFISSDLQSPAREFNLEYLHGTNAALDMLCRRSREDYHNITVLYPTILNYFARVVINNKLIKLENKEKLFLRLEDGGVGCHVYAQTDRVYSTNKKFKSKYYDIVIPPIKNAKFHAQRHMDNHLSKRLAYHKFDTRVIQSIRRKAIEAISTSNANDQQLKDLQDLRKFRLAERIEFSNKVHINKINYIQLEPSLELKIQNTVRDMLRINLSTLGHTVGIARSKYNNGRFIAGLQVRDIEVEVQRAIGICIQEGAISGAVARELRDENGSKLTMMEVFSKFDEPAVKAIIGNLGKFYPSEFINRYVENDIETVRNTFGVLSPELNLVLNQAHSICSFNPQVPTMNRSEFRDYLSAINKVIADTFMQQKLNEKYSA